MNSNGATPTPRRGLTALGLLMGFLQIHQTLTFAFIQYDCFGTLYLEGRQSCKKGLKKNVFFCYTQ
jgi:hypothetical protein